MKTSRDEPKRSLRKRSRTALPVDRARTKSRAAAGTQSVSRLTESAGVHWTFLTNHGHVLVLLARNPSVVLREVALQVGITERAVQRIIADLEACGIIDREKIGRQNHYRIRPDQPLRHPNESHRSIGQLLALINGTDTRFLQ
jgi:predicted transcriptional regulator